MTILVHMDLFQVISAYLLQFSLDNAFKLLFIGQIMSIVKDGCRKAFQNQPQRLVSPMYTCNIIVQMAALGKFISFYFIIHTVNNSKNKSEIILMYT